jgi:hypothetical protein
LWGFQELIWKLELPCTNYLFQTAAALTNEAKFLGKIDQALAEDYKNKSGYGGGQLLFIAMMKLFLVSRWWRLIKNASRCSH